MEAVKKAVAVTPEMAREIRKHYKKQGLTDEDLQISDEGGLVPVAPRKRIFTSWKRWKSGNGFIACCPVCARRADWEDVSRERLGKLRFNHCGISEKLPLLLRILYWFE